MKKIALGIATLLLMASCSSKENSGETGNDSIAPSTTEIVTADSVANNSDSIVTQTENETMAEAPKPSNPLSVLDFCDWDKQENAMTLNQFSKTTNKLKSLGFTRKSDKVIWEGEDDASGEYMKMKRCVYELSENGENITVTIEYTNDWPFTAIINFPTAEMTESFLQTVTANHYKKKSASRYVGQSSSQYVSGTEIIVNGNKVTIKRIGEA